MIVMAKKNGGSNPSRSPRLDRDHRAMLKKARRAPFKLICLSPHKKPCAPPVSSLELHAKAGVLAALYGFRKGEQPSQDEQTYIGFFAGEVLDFLVAHHPTTS